VVSPVTNFNNKSKQPFARSVLIWDEEIVASLDLVHLYHWNSFLFVENPNGFDPLQTQLLACLVLLLFFNHDQTCVEIYFNILSVVSLKLN
jgi:hypothetical protein